MNRLNCSVFGFVIFISQPEGNVDKANQHRNFDQGPDNSRESLSAVYSKHANRNRDCQLKVIACCGERYGCVLRIVCSKTSCDKKTNEKHQAEIDNQRNGNTHNIERNLYDKLAFDTEHDYNGKEKGR